MRYTYHIARLQASQTRKAYEHLIPTLPVVRPARPLSRAVVTFSSAHDLPEQVASLRSLLRHVGQPPQITVVSDGTHRERHREWLRALNPAVEVVAWHDYAAPGLPESVWRYSRVHPLGKKLAVLMSLQDRPAMYADSDVLFFEGAGAGHEIHGDRTFYLPDLPGGLDDRVVARAAQPPANAGMFLLSGVLPLRDVVDAQMPARVTSSDVYLEQALVHLALHRAGAQPLPSAAYVLRTDDMFRYRDACRPDRTVLRHYIGMVRYKFWLAVGRAALRLR